MSYQAAFFKTLFRISFFSKRYFGFYKRIFLPFHFFKGEVKTIYFRGFKLKLHLDDWIQQNIYFKGSYENIELNWVEKNLNTGDVFIDIGANIGVYTLTAAQKIAQGKVYAFEPFEQNHNSLLSNIELNTFQNIQVEKLAIAECKKNISLFYDEADKNLGMVSAYNASMKNETIIKAVALDDYAAENKINKIAIVKMDIEGNELFALQGMKNILNYHQPKLLIEIDAAILSRTTYVAKDIFDFLDALNYAPFYFNQSGYLVEKEPAVTVTRNVVFLPKKNLKTKQPQQL